MDNDEILLSPSRKLVPIHFDAYFDACLVHCAYSGIPVFKVFPLFVHMHGGLPTIVN